MERFKVKKVIFMIFLAIFLFIFTQTGYVSAQEDYTIEIESVTGLTYGDAISKGRIVIKEQSVPGEVFFQHPDRIVNTAGEYTVWVTFKPTDMETYGNGVSIPFVADVAKKNIEIIFDSPIYKRYDGTEQVDLPQYSYIGIINNEVTVVGDLQGSFNGSYVAEEVGITLSGVVLEGEKKDCYNLVLTGHYGRIHPTYINDVSNRVSIEFSENVYVDVLATVDMKNIIEVKKVNKLYTSFMLYEFSVYDHNNQQLDVRGNYTVGLKIDEDIISKERLEVFELSSNNEYKELSYTYNNGVMRFEMDPNSQIVFTTRNVEYGYIILFCGILLVSLGIIVVYWFTTSREDYSQEEEE